MFPAILRQLVMHALPRRGMVAGLLFLLAIPPVQATTLLGMTIDELVSRAELVFQGEVLSVQSLEDPSGQISSFVTFTVDEVIKGDFDAATLELEFMGGAVNGRIMEVSGLRMPVIGETGIYFVESLSIDLVNPLLGWSQGHYLVQEDETGVPRITTTDNSPVTEIQPVSNVPPLIRRPQSLLEGYSDAATGVMTEASPLLIERAMSAEEFKSRIRELDGNPLP